MANIHIDALDSALSEISTNTNTLHICSSEPADYAGIAAVSLGTKASPTFSGPTTGDTSGRKITIDSISNGNVTSDGTAGYWVLADTDGSRLLASGSLGSTQVVTNGNTFTLSAFDIEIQSPS